MYVTDALKVIAKNTANKKDDLIIETRWLDTVEPPKKKEKEEVKTADDVITDIRAKLLKFKQKER